MVAETPSLSPVPVPCRLSPVDSTSLNILSSPFDLATMVKCWPSLSPIWVPRWPFCNRLFPLPCQREKSATVCTSYSASHLHTELPCVGFLPCARPMDSELLCQTFLDWFKGFLSAKKCNLNTQSSEGFSGSWPLPNLNLRCLLGPLSKFQMVSRKECTISFIPLHIQHPLTRISFSLLFFFF